MDVIVIIVDVDVIAPVIVAVHMNGNAPVEVIDTVDAGIEDALCQRRLPVVPRGPITPTLAFPVHVHGHDHGGDHVHAHAHDHDHVHAN